MSSALFCNGVPACWVHTAVIAASFRCSSGLPGNFAVACGSFVLPLPRCKNWRPTRKGWQPTCLQAAVLQFTTATRKRVGNLHVCKLQCFSSLRHHAKRLATYMFASCSASVHYGITQKGWRPTCLEAAVLQFTMYHCARVGDLHVCKLAALHFMRASTGW